ncbi:unnamed protein product, partial [Ixodes hexagonus]
AYTFLHLLISEVGLPTEIAFRLLLMYDESIVADYEDIDDVPAYALKFIKALNERFKDSYKPHINFTLVETGPVSPGWYEINTEPYLNVTEALSKFQILARNVMNHSAAKKFDLGILLTRRLLTGPAGEVELTGYSQLGGVCDPKKDVAIVQDDGRSLNGVTTAVQQLSHLLGANFDGHSGAKACPASDGYLMSNTLGHTKHDLPSQCTQMMIRANLRRLTNESKACWQGQSKTYELKKNKGSGRPTTYVHGNITYCMTAFKDYQGMEKCKDASYQDKMCRKYCCITERKHARVFNITAPDSTPCGNKTACINGECTNLLDLRIFEP